MSMIRPLRQDDIPKLSKLHQKFFTDEFSIYDFLDKILNPVAITDDNDEKIIVAGGIRPIMEAVAITNKDINIKERRYALYSLLQALTHTASKCNYSQIHAFIQDPKWQQHLEKVGFRETKGKSLVIEVQNG